MKIFYLFAILLFMSMANSVNAQFIELVDKEPVFWIKFDEILTIDDREFLSVEGSEAYYFKTFSDEWVEDTVMGHPWGGTGLFSEFTSEEQVVNSDEFEELFLPTMFFKSYLAAPERPQGIGGYSNVHGAYIGPKGTSARTISFYLNVSDSARSDTTNGAWDSPYFYGTGMNNPGERLYWYFDPQLMKFNIYLGDGNTSSTAENVITNDEWVHLALTIPEGGARADMKLYVNGVQTDFTEHTGDVETINTTQEADWDGIRIGALVNLWLADYRIYDVELTQDDIAVLLGKGTSVPNLVKENLFNVYPVPNNGIFTLEMTDHSSRNVTIKNTLGQIVHQQLIDQKGVINISDLPSGLYFISVIDSQNNYHIQKVLKQ